MSKRKARKMLTTAEHDELLVAAETLVKEQTLGEELQKLHMLFDTVCLVEMQLPDDGPAELLGAVWDLRDKVADHIATTIKTRLAVRVLP